MTLPKDSPPSFLYFDLLTACTLNGCPVCRMSAHAVKRYLDSLFYEYVNDSGTRENLIKSLGFCSEHVRLLLDTRIADGLGASIIYEHIIKVILRSFPNQSFWQNLRPTSSRPKDRGRIISQLVSASENLGPCVACKQRDVTTESVIYELSKSIREEKLKLALQASDGVCFPHLAQLLERIQESQDVVFLLDLTESKLKSREAEMAEVIRKNNHQFSSEQITLNEALAWKKAMSMISGASLTRTGDKHE